MGPAGHATCLISRNMGQPARFSEGEDHMRLQGNKYVKANPHSSIVSRFDLSLTLSPGRCRQGCCLMSKHSPDSCRMTKQDDMNSN